MKLFEIKTSLIETFFKDNDKGLNISKAPEIFIQLRNFLNEDVINKLMEKNLAKELSFIESDGTISADPSKSINYFCRNTESLLLICEEDKTCIFAAVRFKTKISFVDLTKPLEYKIGNLSTIKQALHQSKKLNDNTFFNIINR